MAPGRGIQLIDCKELGTFSLFKWTFLFSQKYCQLIAAGAESLQEQPPFSSEHSFPVRNIVSPDFPVSDSRLSWWRFLSTEYLNVWGTCKLCSLEEKFLEEHTFLGDGGLVCCEHGRSSNFLNHPFPQEFFFFLFRPPNSSANLCLLFCLLLLLLWYPVYPSACVYTELVQCEQTVLCIYRSTCLMIVRYDSVLAGHLYKRCSDSSKWLLRWFRLYQVSLI